MNYKKKANITLSLVAALFVLFAVLKYYYRDITLINLILFTAEAALIGGMADWFAVTAIFKKPLGFPFHTAIIPRNRRVIIDSIANIVEKEILNVELLNQRFEKVNITNKIITLAESEAGKENIRKLTLKFLSNSIENGGAKKIYEYINDILKDSFKSVSLNKYLNEILVWSIEKGQYKRAFMFVLENIITVAEGPGVRNRIYKVIDEIKREKTQGMVGGLFSSMLEQSNIVNVDELTDSVHMQLIQTLYNLKDENHQTTKNIMGILEEYLIVNTINPYNLDQMENIKNNILSNILTEKMVLEILSDIENAIENMGNPSELALIEKDANKLSYMVTNLINSCWENFKNNDEIKKSIEALIKKSILNIIEKEHKLIGNIIIDTLDSFSDDDLNKFIEDRAGNDLQWIRINGSIVGGMVGVLIFLFLNFFYDPIIVPLIRGLFL